MASLDNRERSIASPHLEVGVQRSGVRRCSDCLHWRPYPQLTRIGTCDYPGGKYHNRGVPASSEPCEAFVRDFQADRICGNCNGWYPLDVHPHLGECHTPDSPNFGRPVYFDRTSGDCFEQRTLINAEFVFCETCKLTVPRSDLGAHRTHALFAGAAQFPVEEMYEFTTAAD